jgi:hypothetical protein
MVERPNNYSERALAQFLNYFVTVVYVVVIADVVFLLVSIKSVVCCFV